MSGERKSSYSNPYWAKHIKPHFVDTEEIRSLCLRTFQLTMSTHGVASIYTNLEAEEDGQDSDVPNLLALYSKNSERELSNSLLRVSILVRTLEDQLINSPSRDKFKAEIDKINLSAGPFGTVYEGGNINLTLRECCNKIIHAEDFRPVYDNDGDSNDGGWAINGDVELSGTKGDVPWSVTVSLAQFLEGILITCDAADRIGQLKAQ